MKNYQNNTKILMGAAMTLMAVQPVQAASTQVTAVQLQTHDSGLEVRLKTVSGDERPQIFTVSRGNELVADILNTQLNLPQGNQFRQENPMTGISAVEVDSLDGSSIRVTVRGESVAPTGQIVSQEADGITLSFAPTAGNLESNVGLDTTSVIEENLTASNSEIIPLQVPSAETTPPVENLDDVTNNLLPTQTNASSNPPLIAQESIPDVPPPDAQPEVQEAQPDIPAPQPEVLFPDPEIIIEGQPAPPALPAQPVAPAPPFLPRAVAPPVGDISVSTLNTAPAVIDLGTAARVPRLVLRDAPVREVLSLLARTAELNLVYAGGDAEDNNDEQASSIISLDLENEPVQEVFNTVLQVSGLEANRRGRTIFVGANLPDAARNLISRTFRLNQIGSADAAAFLSAQGAETQRVISVTIRTVEGEGANQITRTETSTAIEPLGAEEGNAPLLLKGLSVLTDERLNAVTLVGMPRQVEIATSFLTQLDARRRQVAINVKIVDINLLNTENFNSSFSFGVGNGFFVNDDGAAVFNYGEFTPPDSLNAANSLTGRTTIPNPFSDAQTFIDLDNTTAIAGTDPGTIVVDNRNGTVTRIAPRGALNFFDRFAPVDDPLQAGIINVTQAQDNIITIDAEGAITVAQGTLGTSTSSLPDLFQFPKDLLATLQAQIVSGNAKILTDPTIVVQEGQTASVNLTQDVVGNISSETETSDNLTTRTITAEIEQAGLQLELVVDRIDDNGFINLAVNPTVTSIGSVQDLSVGDNTNQIALLNRRELNSGRIRLRDGQTLILSGIIQESDRTTVSKIPILGDLPIIGSLFRSTNRQNQRQEVIILVTPQVMDDSERYGNWGYNYTPGDDARQLLRNQGFDVQGPPATPSR